MTGIGDAVLLLPESYDLPDVGFREILTWDKPKTGKTLSQYEVDLLKKLLPKVKRTFENVKVNPNFYAIKDTTKVIEGVDHPISPLIMAILPDNLERIEDWAFMEMDNLVYIRIPDNVKYIGQNAFKGCYFIKENFVNNSELDAEENDYWGAEIVDEEIDGMLIVNNIVVDARRCFCDSVIIPNTVTHIGDDAFHSCHSLTSVTIPNSVTYIGEAAFSDCYDLTSITIPNSVKSIGEEAFYCCEKLTEIICHASTPPKIGEFSIDNYFNPTIYVPQGAVAAYLADADWGKFTIQAIP